MALEERIIITGPHVQYSPAGKILPVATVEIVKAIFDGAIQRGKGQRHVGVMVIQADGTWAFEPHPVDAETNQPYEFTAAQTAAFNALLDTYEVSYGVEDHAFEDGAISVQYVRGESGAFARVVTGQ